MYLVFLYDENFCDFNNYMDYSNYTKKELINIIEKSKEKDI